ncbi:MAG: cytochrome b/b6 domain-containing protein [Mycobacteriales bacterium]
MAAHRASYGIRRSDEARSVGGLVRFTLAERWVHRSLAALMAVMIATAATLYFGQLSLLVGRRQLVAEIHIYAGMALPLPILLGLVSRAFRDDLRRLNRFLPVDQVWLRSKNRRSARLPVAKFNAGQKLYAAFLAGAILVMLGTGLVMRYANGWPVSLRTGATFVHDWLSYALTFVIAGHLYFALRDPIARRGMRTGLVPDSWARVEHGKWAEEMTEEKRKEPRPADTEGDLNTEST